MRIGIFGGSFDPVHIEHIRVAQSAIKGLGLDKLLIMPAYAPPHKPYKALAPDKHRLAACRLAFADLEKAEVCDFEIAQKGTSYTYLTCRHFKQKYPSAELFWLVGTDMLRDFPTWREPESILTDTRLAVCARNEQDGWLEAEQAAFYQKFHKRFAVVSYNGADVSSTKIRVLAGAGEDISALVGEKVASYVQEHKLYSIDNAAEALALEKPSRKAHSLRVAEVAAKKAATLRIPEIKAIAAALFHDCGKNVDAGSPLLQGFALPKQWGEVPKSVWHQFAGAYLAKTRFGIDDEDIVNAVKYHTSGRENMSELEKLIFLADMVEEERDYDVVDKIRAAFWTGETDDCLLLALKETVAYLQKSGARVYPLTLEALAYYQRKNQEKRRSL